VVETPALPDSPARAGSPPVKGRRPVRWGDDYADTDLYELTDVEAGSSITGPAIVESVATTFAIPPGREARLDRHHIFHLSAALE
jgi:acetone carboxylase beta subunit